MKNMKKSMFITTLMMVVLLIVAISTSTFAWFSANDTVTATQTTMTAATSSAANITIGWNLDTGMGSTITFNSDTDLQPSVPKFMPSIVSYNTTDQYVATNDPAAPNPNVSYTITYNTDDEAPYLNVIYVNTANTVALATAAASYDGLVGTPTALTRIYRTQYAKAQYYRMTNVTVSSDLITQFEVSAGVFYDYLQIVADGTAVNPNDITVTDATANYTLYAASDNGLANALTPVAGQRIYNIDAVEDIHVVVAIGAAAPAGAIAGGIDGSITVPGSVDFDTVVTSLGVVDQRVGEEAPYSYYINIEDAIAAPYNCVGAAAGDKVYKVRPAGVSRPRTTYTALTTMATYGLWTDSIDQEERFRTGEQDQGITTLTNSDLATDNVFYIRNNNAPGSQPATITMSTTITGEATNHIRLAVFVSNHGETEFNYVGTIANTTSDTYFGSIVKGGKSNAANLESYSADGLVLADFIQIDPSRSARIKVIAWYDGIALGTEQSGQAANFIFNFSAANAE